MKRNTDVAEITDGNSNNVQVSRVENRLEEGKMAYEGHPSKRQRTDMDGHGLKSSYGEKYGDRQKVSSSPVVHVRGLSDSVTQRDLAEAVRDFGAVRDILMLPKNNQALIEFDEIRSAVELVSYAQTGKIHVAGYSAEFNFSKSQEIKRNNANDARGSNHGGNPGPGSNLSNSRNSVNNDPSVSGTGNHILLFTVLNPVYPITVDVMHTICESYGTILRIVVFKKHSLQAMVEFDSADSAAKAKTALQGCDIYSGCCTLKIDYAKTSKLNVHTNNSESWDYTNPNPGREPATPPRSAPLLQNPHYSSVPTPYSQSGHPPPPGRGYPPASGHPGYGREMGPDEPYNNGYSRHPPSYGYHPPPPDYGRGAYGRPEYGRERYPPTDPYGPPPDRYNGPVPTYGKPPMYGDRGPAPPHGGMHDPMAGAGHGPQGTTVIMVYGLNTEKMNADKLFNMFCLYGNVLKVKFLKSKEGVAMIQMGDALSVDRALVNLNNSFFFDSKLQLAKSKQQMLQNVMNPYDLPDGTPSFKMFERNNRFLNPESAQKNRIHPPAKVLHYFNAPPGLSEDEIKTMIESKGIKGPTRVKPFPSKSERSSTGLIEFENKAEAMEALITVNHEPVPNPNGKIPYCFKLCFSMAPIKQTNND